MKLTLVHKFALEDIAKSPGKDSAFWASRRTIRPILDTLKDWGLVKVEAGAWYPTDLGNKCLADRNKWLEVRAQSEVR